MPTAFPARPLSACQPRLWLGDDAVVFRSPAEVREAWARQVIRWFHRQAQRLSPEADREQILASVFTSEGWIPIARVAQAEEKRSLYGWLLRHPDHGVVVFADKTRAGDLYDGSPPVSGGPWGGVVKILWGSDLADMMSCEDFGANRFPANRTALALAVHAFRVASEDDQQAVRLMMALCGRNIGELVAAADNDTVQVLPIAG